MIRTIVYSSLIVMLCGLLTGNHTALTAGVVGFISAATGGVVAYCFSFIPR